MTDMEAIGLKCVRIEGDSKVLHVQLPKEIEDRGVRIIAILAKIIEEGKASVSLDEIDGRPAILLTIRGEGFPLHLPVGKAKHGAREMTDELKPKLGDVPDELKPKLGDVPDELKPKLGDVPDELTNEDEALLRQVCRDFVDQEVEQELKRRE